jgi:hypothetical protein
LCAVKVVKHYKSMTYPETINFFAKEMGPAAINKLPDDLKHVWYHPSSPGKTTYNKGKDKVLAATKELAQMLGAEDWEQFTNHANRAHLITRMNMNKIPDDQRLECSHHSSIKSQAPYICPTAVSRAML